MTEIQNLSSYIDHTLLTPTATSTDIERLCTEAIRYEFCSVCIHPRWISLAAELLIDSKVKVASVVGFPFGTELTKIKAAQAKEAIFAGADEIDMVADLAAIIEANDDYYLKDLMAVKKICHSMKPTVTLKVIIESAALTDQQKIFACRLADNVGVDFIKTSTGLHPAGGATIDDIKLMKINAPKCKIKAAGGIKTYQQAIDMIQAGAQRIGTSSGVQIIEQFKQDQNK
ncbi:MAG: deoxyribose-phosphate aldolase [Phycisphaerae bacterium]|nr:deoxyribose-phosphate aldolase [Phycisphaerae bacterium]